MFETKRNEFCDNFEVSESAVMERGYGFSVELLQMMLSEERQKFVSALGRGASWRELRTIRKNIIQISNVLDDSMENQRRDAVNRSGRDGLRE